MRRTGYLAAMPKECRTRQMRTSKADVVHTSIMPAQINTIDKARMDEYDRRAFLLQISKRGRQVENGNVLPTTALSDRRTLFNRSFEESLRTDGESCTSKLERFQQSRRFAEPVLQFSAEPERGLNPGLRRQCPAAQTERSGEICLSLLLYTQPFGWFFD